MGNVQLAHTWRAARGHANHALTLCSRQKPLDSIERLCILKAAVALKMRNAIPGTHLLATHKIFRQWLQGKDPLDVIVGVVIDGKRPAPRASHVPYHTTYVLCSELHRSPGVTLEPWTSSLYTGSALVMPKALRITMAYEALSSP